MGAENRENGGKFDVQAEKEHTKKPSEQNSEGFGAAVAELAYAHV